MPKVVYNYFPLKALGEGIRLLLSYGGQEFEDNRIPSDKWPEYKPSTPFGQMPVLVIDGKQYSQSLAISRYLGRKYGLVGADLEEDFEIDQIVDFINDIRARAATVAYEPDEQLKKKKHEDFSKNVYPVLLSKLNNVAEKNNGYVALGKLTWGDFVLAGMFDYLKDMMQDQSLDQKYPALKKVADNVYSLPQLQAYLAQAPNNA
nr:glutathione S-transferase sigma 7 [Conogethes punctiferalis]